eukprot:jgi/Tetstr1/466707/TSEL_011180.t1
MAAAAPSASLALRAPSSRRAAPAPSARLAPSQLVGGFTTSTRARADTSRLAAAATVAAPRAGAARQVTVMGNPNTNGIFAPIVRVARTVIGKKRFNSIRGQGIALHSQVIRSFIGRIGGDNKMIQKLIKKAKKNGETLGFLA